MARLWRSFVRLTAITSSFVRLRPVVTFFTIVVVAIPAFALAYRDRIAFVSPCMNNGHSFHDCSCTFAALPKLPPSYKTVVLAWAHKSTLAYGTETLVFGTGQAAKTVKSEMGFETSQAKDAQKPPPWVFGAVQIAFKRLGLGWVKAIAAPIATLVLLDKLTDEFSEARGALGDHCGGTIDRILGSYHRLKSALDSQLKSLGVISKNGAARAAETTLDSATAVWNWIASKWPKI